MNQQNNTPEQNISEQIIKQVINSWTTRNNAITNFFNKYPESSYLQEVAPGKNRAVYLLGHLIASSDSLLPLFGLGEKLFPGLESFAVSPDKSFYISLTFSELKQNWEKLNFVLTDHFNKMPLSQWLEKHTAVSEEDFIKDPQRNKLNVLMSRTNHQSYHLGQLNLLTLKETVT